MEIRMVSGKREEMQKCGSHRQYEPKREIGNAAVSGLPGAVFTIGREGCSTQVHGEQCRYRNRRRILLAMPAVTRAPIPASASPSA